MGNENEETFLIFLSLQEAADEVIDIFSQSEPVMLVSVCTSPCMINVSPARTLQILQNLEDSVGVSVSLTITMATMMLRLGDLQQYTQLMERHAEVRISLVFFAVLTAQGAVQGQSLLHDIASFFFFMSTFFSVLYILQHKMDQNEES